MAALPFAVTGSKKHMNTDYSNFILIFFFFNPFLSRITIVSFRGAFANRLIFPKIYIVIVSRLAGCRISTKKKKKN